jgi:hypothetical protein
MCGRFYHLVEVFENVTPQGHAEEVLAALFSANKPCVYTEMQKTRFFGVKGLRLQLRLDLARVFIRQRGRI